MIPNMATATYQELFDYVAIKLLEQGKKAIGPISLLCLYRAPDGAKCAIGHLIPDSQYEALFEGIGVVNVMIRLGVSDQNRRYFLRNLQGCHDYLGNEVTKFAENFTAAMNRLARIYYLSTVVLLKAS